MSLAETQLESPAAQTGLTPPYSEKEFEDFIYLISHDVRNSVRALIELPQWIVEDLKETGVKIDGSVAESIEMMNTHTGRLDRMLVDLLAFSRVGRMQEVGPVELDFALSEVLEEVRIPQGFQVIPMLDTNVVVMGERDILTLLTALVTNAIKHHDQAQGEIHVGVRDEGGSVCIAVSDDGPGIPAKFHEKVFGAMTTLRPRDEVEGSGMGLAIARKIASTYGGHICLISKDGERGTTIKVFIPKV